jgi:cell division transport system permease protein
MKSNKQNSNSKNTTLIVSIASLAFMISLFFQIILGANRWKNEITSQMKMYIYLEDSLNVNQINTLVNKFKREPYLNKVNGRSDIEFISKNKTAREFILKNKENFEDLLGENNPFKNLLIIGISDDFKNEAKFNVLAKDLSNINGVYEVTFPNRYVSLLLEKMNQISTFLFFIMFSVCVFVYLQISNFVKINIHSNRILIKSMQLLGSTNHYIRKPYLIDSLIHGLLGGVLGSLIAYLLIYYFSNSIPELKEIIKEGNMQILSFLICILFCCMFSFFSTIFSINLKLKTSISNLI